MTQTIKPIVLTDLDDTLFQTKRKMVGSLGQEPVRVAALDRSLTPLSFQTQEQADLFDWLSLHAEVIPVTARDTHEITRVKLPFTSWAITTHGAVLLDRSGTPFAPWQAEMERLLAGNDEKIALIEQCLRDIASAFGVEVKFRTVSEYQRTIYLVVKHTDNAREDELSVLHREVLKLPVMDGFYVHQNANNLAILPTFVTKGRAVQFLIDHLRTTEGVRPTIGFGDSLSDHSFLQLCSWFGMPRQSQLSTAVQHQVNTIHGVS